MVLVHDQQVQEVIREILTTLKRNNYKPTLQVSFSQKTLKNGKAVLKITAANDVVQDTQGGSLHSVWIDEVCGLSNEIECCILSRTRA